MKRRGQAAQRKPFEKRFDRKTPGNGVLKRRNANLFKKGLIEKSPSSGVLKRRNA
jgi:hypothetical protein